MAATVAEAFVTVRPDMDRFGSDLRSGLGRLTRVAGAAALGITAAIGGAAVAGVRQFAQLESGMNEVFTLLPDITDTAMSEMTQQVRDFSVEMGTATTDVVPALYQALSAGVPQDTVFDFLETANKAAIGGITSLETAVDGITSVVNAYGDDVIDASEASDLMFTAVRLGKTDFEQLSRSLSNVIPIAAANKVQFGDVAAALATMTAQGVPTAQATTQLRQAIVELSDSGSAVGKAFEEVANESFRDFIASGGDMGGVMEILQDAAEEAGVSVDQLFGSVEAGSAVLALSGDNLEGFRDNLNEAGDAAGATEGAFDRMDAGLSRAWDRIKTTFADLIIEIGERVAPTVQAFADWFVENLPGIIDRLEEAMDWFGRVGAAVADWWSESAKPAIDEFVAAVEENWPKVESIFDSLGRMVSSVASIFSTEFDNMARDSGATSESIEDDVTTVIEALDGFAAFVATTSEVIAFSWNVLAGGIKNDAGQMAIGLDDLTGGALSRFEEGFDQAMTNVALAINDFTGGAWFEFMAAIRAGVGEAVETFVQGMADIVVEVASLPGRIVAALSNLGDLLRQEGREIIGGLLGGMREKWDETVGWLNSLGGRIRELKGPIEKDRVLLEDIGEEIIGGLGRGMNREWAAIERQLGVMTAEIPLAASPQQAGPQVGQMYGDVSIQVTEPLQSAGEDVAHQIRKLAFR